MYNLRRLQALVMGHEVNTSVLHTQLEASSVPVSLADCRTCADPCDLGHEAYPNRFDIDMETQMLGSVKPYRRQVVISTGKVDWDREITETKGSLASYLLQVQNQSPPPAERPLSPPHANGKAVRSISGVFRSTDSTKISILNGSHSSISDDIGLDTVLVLPDYKVVADVSKSIEGAQDLWDSAVDPSIGRVGAFLEKSPLKTWVLPYSCVILLCSHKKRDNRCSIAAPKLERAFLQSLEDNGWTADTQLAEPSHSMGAPLEEFQGTPEETEEHIRRQLVGVSALRHALIIRNSHMGGHKYAGNCIIYTPQGSSVWYGRVTPHDVESIVVNTIIGGLVLPPLLRGGLDISRPGCKTLHDW